MHWTGSLLLCLLPCIIAFGSSTETEHHARERRELRMLRLGKRSSPAVRVGRSVSPNANYLLYDDLPELYHMLTKENDLIPARDTRNPPLPRLGEEELDQIRRMVERSYQPHIPRMGRYVRSVDSLQNSDRSVPLPRVGLRELLDKMEESRAVPLPRIGYRELDEERAAPLPRLGLRELEELAEENMLEENERAAPLPRLGLRDEEERAAPLPRIGIRDLDNEKRAMGMLRMGRSQPTDKRAMGMLRMGKKSMGMLRMGKRNLDAEEEKRGMSMLRMGKRAMGMLRMGRSDGSNPEILEKKGMSMLRMGKRAMGMLRMGKRSMDEEEGKRAMGMLRMGRGLSMLRLGRGLDEAEEKRAMGMLRMGKRSMNEVPDKKAMGMLRMGKRDLHENSLEKQTDEDQLAQA